jgi:transporter family-2 protein
MFHAFLALLAGTVLPVQAGINSSLRTHVGQPIWAALFSFCVGAIVLFTYGLATRVPLPALSGVPLWAWSGGALGAVYVTCAVFLAPKLGAGALIGLTIAGQLLASVILDHFGWMGFETHPINWQRVLGLIFLGAGVWLVKQF